MLGAAVDAIKALREARIAKDAEALTADAAKATQGSIIPTIGGRRPINSKYAGQTHQSGVKFNSQGFAVFSPFGKAKVEIKGLTGDNKFDESLANNAMGYPRTPKGYTWQHVEAGQTMELVPQGIHQATRHTGGAAIIRNGGLDQ